MANLRHLCGHVVYRMAPFRGVRSHDLAIILKQHNITARANQKLAPSHLNSADVINDVNLLNKYVNQITEA